MLTAIVSGQTIAGVISSKGQEVSYTFTATDGQSFEASLGAADAISSTFTPRISIYTPSGVLVGNYSPGTPDAHDSTEDGVGNAVAGAYTIVVQSYSSSNTGTYALELAAAPATQATDSDGDGGLITSGQTKIGTINRPGDLDVFTYNATAGQSFEASLGVADEVSTFTPRISIYTPSGVLVGNYSPGTPDAHGSTEDGVGNAVAGAYTIVVQSYSSSNTGTYALELAAAPATQATDSDGDGGLITSGQTKIGTINRPGDLDVFTYNATAGQSFEASLGVADEVSTFTPRISIYTPSGVLVGNYSPGTPDAHDSTEDGVGNAVAGAYTIVVQSYSSSNNGTYALELAAAPATQATDSDGDGGLLTTGTTTVGNINRPGDIDVFTFQATAGDDFQFAMSGGGSADGLEPEFDIYDPTGKLVSDASNASGTAQGSYTVQSGESGIYTVIVQSANPTSTGSYSVDVTGNLLLSLANLSSDTYNAVPLGYSPEAFSPLQSSSDSLNLGYSAEAYTDTDGQQIVLAVRGSVFDPGMPIEFLKSVAADVSFDGNNTTPTADLREQVSDFANFVADVREEFPLAQLILTGHSLGGAIAQLVGKASGLETEVFNAPGATELYNSLSVELSPAKSLGTSGVNVNYRLTGDQVSLFGVPVQSVVKLAAPESVLVAEGVTQDDFVEKEPTIADLHSISLVISQLEDNALFDPSTGDEANYAQLLQAFIAPNSTQSNVGYKAYKYSFKVLNKASLVDPDSGSDFTLTGDAGSPGIVSIDLPPLSGVSSYKVRYESAGNWSALQSILPSVEDDFASSATAIEFQPFNSSGQNVAVTDSFLFGLGFDGSGTFSGTLLAGTPQTTGAPTVTLTTPTGSSSTNKNKPIFVGAASDASGDSTTVTISIYSGSTATGTPIQTLTTTETGGSYTVAPNTALPDGTYTAHASQSSTLGDTGTSSANTFTIDTVAPALTLTTPANGSMSTNTTPTFSGSAGNATGDSSTVTVKVYRGNTATGTPVQTLTATRDATTYSVAASQPLAVGIYTAQANQSDAAGNAGTSSTDTFTTAAADTTPPTVTLTSPANGSSTSINKPTLGGSAGTASGDLPTVTIKIYSGSTATGTPVQTLTTTANGGSYSVAPSGALSDGMYTAQANQSDSSGNVGTSAADTFTVDTVAPVVTLTSPANGSTTGSTTPTFSGLAGTASGDSAIISVKLYSGGTATGTPVQMLTATLNGNGYTVAASAALIGGTYTVQASQLDAAGNTGTSTANTFTINTSVPAVTLTSPANGSSTNNNKPTIGGAIGTASGDSTTVTIKIYSGSTATGAPVQTLTAIASGGAYSVAPSTSLPDGAYTAQAIQSNVNGNTGTSNADTFAVDTVAPTITLTTPANGSSPSNTTPTFSGSAGTTAGDLTTVKVKVYSGNTATGTPVQTLTAVVVSGSYSVGASFALSGGAYTAQAIQSDAAGNTGVSSANTFSINSATAAPVVTTDPQSRTVTAGADVTFTASASGNPTPTVQWYQELAGADTFLPVEAQTSTTLHLGAAALTESGNKYEAVFTNGVGTPATTNAATLTVTPAATAGGGRLTGTYSANTASSYQNDGDDYTKAFDGNDYTFFDAPTGSANWIQIDLGSPQTITQIAYAPRPAFEYRMVGGMFEASNDPTFTNGVVKLYTVNATPGDGLTTQTVSPGGSYQYVRYVSPANSYDNIAEFQVFGANAAPAKIPGIASANTTASYKNEGNTYANAFDGNTNTFFDAPTANGNWVQLDLGLPHTITSIAFAPRAGFEYRMVGGYFETSNDPAFSTGVVPLYTITSTPADGLTTQPISVKGTYRYIRYVSPSGSYGDIAETQVYGSSVASGQLSGTASANTTASYDGQTGDNYLAAFDGSTNSYFDAPTASGNYVQLDLRAAHTLTSISFAPRSGYEFRMVGGYFEASDDPTFSMGVTVLYTINSTPEDGLTSVNVNAAGTFQYVRYVSPAGSYGNMAEMQGFGY